MKRISLLLSFLLLLTSCCCNNDGGLKKTTPESVGMSSTRLACADSVINHAVANSEIPGAVLAVVKDDKLVYLKAYGHKSVVPDTLPMTVNTVFDLASVSKCVGTTLSFMQLVEQGKVRLTDKVSDYILGFLPWVDPETGDTVDIKIGRASCRERV